MAALSSHHGAFVLMAVLALVSGSSISRRQAPGGTDDVCGGSPCPAYDFVKTWETDIDERRYKSTELPSFVSTPCMDFATALNQAYFQLAMYTRGAQNANKAPLKMGVPVLTKVTHTDDVEPKCAQIFTTSYYVDAPSPLPAPNQMTAGVTIQTLPESCMYVQTINGYIADPEESFVALRVRLNALKLSYDKTTYYIANYQSPGKETQRRNEIWVPATECSSSE